MSTISDKTLKQLWGNAAGRCAICNTKLFLDDVTHSCIGENCHIISKKKDGPRHQDNLDDYDCYDNLILLCCNHHKEIDDNPREYTVEKLKRIKEKHEAKIFNSQKNSNRIVELMYKVSSGEELCDMVWGCNKYNIYCEFENTSLLKIRDDVSESIQIMIDIQNDISLREKKELSCELVSILSKGKDVYIYASVFTETIAYGIKCNTLSLFLSDKCNNSFIAIEREK